MELRSCYFCGSTGRTLAARELVPDGLDDQRGDGEPVEVVLCPGCDEKLDRLLGALPGGRPATGTSVDPSPDASGPTEITFDDEADGERTEAAEAGGDEADADATDDEDDPGSTRVGGGTSAADLSAAGRTRSGRDGESQGADDGAGAGSEASNEADEAKDEGGADETADDPDASDDGPATAATDDDSAAETGDDGSGSRSAGQLRGLGESSAGTYRKALRLLQNREFPMERSDLIDVLSSAYDLEYGECERLIDLAVERGWLDEDGDELRRG